MERDALSPTPPRRDAGDTPTAADDAARLAQLDNLADTMDSLFRIPGTHIRVGLDSIIGLIPGIGDAVALAPAGYIVWQARQMGAPKRLIARMGVNIGIDALVGSIPLVGDIFDVGWKGNRRNVALLRRHLEASGRIAPVGTKGQPTSSSPEKK